MVNKCFIILLFVNSFFYSQLKNDKAKIPISSIIAQDALLSLNKSYEFFKSPLTFDNDDMLMTGIVLSITGASFSLDNSIRTSVANQRSKKLDNITYYGEKFGHPIYATILSGLLYSSGLIFSNNYIKETGQILAEAMIFTGLYTQILKISLGRARPYTGKSNTSFEFFNFEADKNSLPSGHTSIAFTIATVLAERTDNIYASIALFSMASLTAYQRIYDDAHWFSDTILGAALGTFIGLKLVKLHENSISKKERAYNLNIFPHLDSQRYGIGFALQF